MTYKFYSRSHRSTQWSDGSDVLRICDQPLSLLCQRSVPLYILSVPLRGLCARVCRRQLCLHHGSSGAQSSDLPRLSASSIFWTWNWSALSHRLLQAWLARHAIGNIAICVTICGHLLLPATISSMGTVFWIVLDQNQKPDKFFGSNKEMQMSSGQIGASWP